MATTKKVALSCSHEQFHGLHKALDTPRAKLVKVDKEALRALLLDHGNLMRYVGDDCTGYT